MQPAGSEPTPHLFGRLEPSPVVVSFPSQGLEDRGHGMDRKVQNRLVSPCISLYHSLKLFKDLLFSATLKKAGSEEIL